jgi:hypothetical protein
MRAGSGCRPNDYEQPEQVSAGLRRILWITLIIGLALIASCFNHIAHADAIPDDRAILAIIGEAENQGESGMLAVACAIRNRGTLKGVYGEKARRVVKGLYTKGTYLKAQEAWNTSARAVDPTHGADHWENVNDFGKPYWADSCQKTVLIKDHQFYKCGKGK